MSLELPESGHAVPPEKLHATQPLVGEDGETRDGWAEVVHSPENSLRRVHRIVIHHRQEPLSNPHRPHPPKKEARSH